MELEHSEITSILIEELGPIGRLISSSKTMYLIRFPESRPVFNANIIVNGIKVWYGDIDLEKDEHELKNAAERIGENLYILREHDARFGTENDSQEELEKRAVETIEPE